MIGIVVVSHSRALAEAAVELAVEASPGAAPPVAVAAGTPSGGLGTDAAAVAGAIQAVDSVDGVLVFVDLGSAVLSAEMALDFLDPQIAARVHVTPAPLVEGLVAAVVSAGADARLVTAQAEAERALVGKVEQLVPALAAVGRPEDPAPVDAAPVAGGGSPGRSEPDDSEADAGAKPSGNPARRSWRRRLTIRNAIGLHLRPAAALVSALSGFDAVVTLATDHGTSAEAESLLRVTSLGVVAGDQVTVTATGSQAREALDVIERLIESGFGEV